MRISVPLRVKFGPPDLRADTARALWDQRRRVQRTARDLSKLRFGAMKLKFIGVENPEGHMPRAVYEVAAVFEERALARELASL
jgi:hypothetical protein